MPSTPLHGASRARHRSAVRAPARVFPQATTLPFGWTLLCQAVLFGLVLAVPLRPPFAVLAIVVSGLLVNGAALLPLRRSKLAEARTSASDSAHRPSAAPPVPLPLPSAALDNALAEDRAASGRPARARSELPRR